MQNQNYQSGAVLLIVTVFMLLFLVMVTGVFTIANIVVNKKRAEVASDMAVRSVMVNVRQKINQVAEQNIARAFPPVEGDQNALNWLNPGREIIVSDPTFINQLKQSAVDVYLKNSPNANPNDLTLIYPYKSISADCNNGKILSAKVVIKTSNTTLFSKWFEQLSSKVSSEGSISTIQICP